MNPELVTQALGTFADFLMKYFIALAAVGALAMALIEAYKKIFDSRTQFHFNFIKKYIDDDSEAFKTWTDFNIHHIHGLRNSEAHYSYSDTFAELIHLISGIEFEKARSLTAYEKGNLSAIFSLAAENMMAKIQDAVDAAIDNPERYPNLYIFATSGSETPDAVQWMKLSRAAIEDNDKLKMRSELYTQLHQLAKRKLDRLQLQMANRWANMNLLWANLLGGLILFITLLWINRENALNFLDCLIILSASTTGGILSPIAKDMTTWLQKVKSRV